MTKKIDNNIVEEIYQALKNREINPSGTFDKGGRFYAENSDCINVREPSRRWPYSEMVACRTKKYVKKVAEKFHCETKEQLRNVV